jgi:outer membrane protein TolC
MLHRLTFVTLLGVFWAAPLAGQLPGDPFAALVQEGLAQNRGLLQGRLGVGQREAEVRRAKGALLPTLGVNARWSEFEGIPDIGDFVNPANAALNQLTGTSAFPTDISVPLLFNQDMRFQATLPLFAPEAYANVALQKALRDAEAGRVQAAERQVAAGVQLAALRVAIQERAVAIYREALGLIDESLRVSERLVAAGVATPDAVARSRADRSEAAQRLQESERERHDAVRALNELLRRPVDAPPPPLPDSLRAVPPELDTVSALAIARARREELAAARALERAAGAQKRLAGASFLPTIALAGDYGWQGTELRFSSDNDFIVGSVVLRWNLLNGGQDRARRQLASLEQERTALATEETVARVEREVLGALDGAGTAWRAIATADDRLAASERTWQLVRRRYEEGLAPHLELSDARTQFTTAALNAALTRFTYAARLVELERVTGARELREGGDVR